MTKGEFLAPVLCSPLWRTEDGEENNHAFPILCAVYCLLPALLNVEPIQLESSLARRSFDEAGCPPTFFGFTDN
jgi:hypothetical protein